ncbi:MAG TPA: putative inorganic carbon transporter subunit DabA, partial [Burkholderiaceae bacterium]
QAAAWDAWRQSPASAFGFVEAWGAAALAKLARASFPSTRATAGPEREGLQARAALRPRFDLMEQEPQRAAELAHSVLRAMGLLQDFPALVLLVGHGSRTTNNPHAAGLACGACGGQSGELNARVLAALLNDREVRGRLAALGIAIPDATHFLAALHDTVTDDVDCFDVAEIPSSLEPPTRRLLAALRQAGERVRAERAESLGLQRLVDRPAALAQALRRRANDWSELRPEWGLAGNAAFIAAPRTRTRGLDLEGRAFLHDYDWRHDPDGSVLELVMTAPMVVAHWINFQYLASTTAPQRFGSGSKVLHNVVGGRIGVFEGNGGDLRIGLPWQSVHDGTRLRHEPLRLAVFIEAPRAMIDAVLRQHAKVRLLVDNGWLHLLRLDAASAFVERYDRGLWRPLEGEASWADALAAPRLAQGAGHEPRVSRL